MKIGIFVVLHACLLGAAYGAEFQGRRPVKLMELNEKTLLQNIWPGMTINQAIQILGEPEEKLPVLYSDGAPAVRYGIYWLIPSDDGLQIECIINQRGLRTRYEKVLRCDRIDKKHILATQ